MHTSLKWNKLHKACKKSFRHCTRNHSSGTSTQDMQKFSAVYTIIILLWEQFVNGKFVQGETDCTIHIYIVVLVL